MMALAGCPGLPVRPPQSIAPPPGPAAPLPEPIVPRFQSYVQPLLDQERSGPQEITRRGLASATGFPAVAKISLALQTLNDPWAGLTAIEVRGLAVAEAARQGRPGLARLLTELATAMDRPGPASFAPSPVPPASLDACLDAMALVLEQAARHREQALRQLSSSDRRFLFEHGGAMVDLFIPHIAPWNDRVQAEAEADRRFVGLLQDNVDEAALLTSAQTLLQLLDHAWVRRIAALQPTVALSPPSGVTGEVLAVRETPLGLIVIGGPDRNSYDLDHRFALVIDVGGDDLYRGQIGATASAEQGVSIVIDLGGDDSYRSSPLGLATGRLGIGLVADLSGNDDYALADGSGGTGFAGIGLLYDETGDDRYRGERLVLGAALGGLGAVVDFAGADTYAGGGYVIGFGGPLGTGALIDVGGNDGYTCGTLPSSYNQIDAPTAAPGDPVYQYDCFGLGVGSGKRIFSPQRDRLLYSLAGGFGLLLDLSGDDRYRSANFSQGAGYFFGVGLACDFDGQDEHHAARYGLAAGAHFGAGLFLDRRGRDRYVSNGPLYTGAAAWDVSVTLAIDAGPDDDFYDLTRSTGLAVADHRSWSVFIDEGGRDLYLVPTGLGVGLTQSLAGFFDLAGFDAYGQPDDSSRADRAGNGALLRREPGGLFLDKD